MQSLSVIGFWSELRKGDACLLCAEASWGQMEVIDGRIPEQVMEGCSNAGDTDLTCS